MSAGWGWDSLKSLAQDTDWKKLSNIVQDGVKRVGTGIDRAIGVPGQNEVNGIDVPQTGTKSEGGRRVQVKRKLSVKKPAAKDSTSTSKATTSSSSEPIPAKSAGQNGHRDELPMEIQPDHPNSGKEISTPETPNKDAKDESPGLHEVNLEDLPEPAQTSLEQGDNKLTEGNEMTDISLDSPNGGERGNEEHVTENMDAEKGSLEGRKAETSDTNEIPDLDETEKRNVDARPTAPNDLGLEGGVPVGGDEEGVDTKDKVDQKWEKKKDEVKVTAKRAENEEVGGDGEKGDSQQSTEKIDPETAGIDPVTLEILSQAKDEYERLEKHTNEVEAQNRVLRESLAKAKHIEATLRAREQQIETLSRENARVSQENNTTKSDLQQTDEQNRELKGKISLLESRIAEIGGLKQRLKDTQGKLERAQRMVEAKDKDVKQAIMEGQKMSKKQHGKDVLIRTLRKQLDAKQAEIERQQRELATKTTEFKNASTRAAAASTQAEASTSKLSSLTKKNLALSERLLEVEGQTRKHQNAAKDLRERSKYLQQEIRARSIKIEKILASLNERKKEKEDLQNLCDERDKEIEKISGLHENARLSIKALETRLRDREQSSAEQERTLQKQLQDLRKKMHENDLKNQELTDAIPHATRPLLKQINALSKQIKTQQDHWNALEEKYKSESNAYREKLGKAEATVERLRNELESMGESFDSSKSERNALKARLSDMESKYSTAVEKSERLETSIEAMSKEGNELKLKRQELIAQRERAEEKLQQLMVSTRFEHSKLRRALQDERRRRKDMADKVKQLEEKFENGATKVDVKATKERKLMQQESEEQVMLSSLTGKPSANKEANMSHTPVEGSNAWNAITKIKDESRQKDGELFRLRQEVKVLNEHRKVLSNKMLQLTSANAENENKLQAAEKVEAEYKELLTKYDLAVDIIGEKEEELMHLREDLEHVKSKFREQIEALLDRIAALEASAKKT